MTEGNERNINYLISKGAEVNAVVTHKDVSGLTALMFAASSGNLAAVRLLLDAGVDLHIFCDAGATALHFADPTKPHRGHEAAAAARSWCQRQA